jgi:cell division septation protein DedD
VKASRRRWWNGVVGRGLVFLPVFPVFPVLPALSQTDPRLIEVIRHAQEGQGDSARIKVQRLLTATSPGDTLYPQIVYTQAMVASDAADMRRQLQRVAVEYSSSSWADDALLRLVQLDYASANLDGAARNLERIRLDYPGSALRPQAAYWAARTYFDQKRPDLACRWISEGLTGSSDNLELHNQLGYLNQRCSQFAGAAGRQPADTVTSGALPADSQQVVAIAPADTGRPSTPRPDTSRTPPSVTPPAVTPAPPPRPPQPAPRADAPRPDSTPAVKRALPSARYRVQITAVRSSATAQSVANKLKSRGFDVVTVEEAGLYKVRVGDYATKAEAVAAVPEIKAKLGGSPFVVTES